MQHSCGGGRHCRLPFAKAPGKVRHARESCLYEDP